MLIRRMTAAFGRFNQETLELSDGLNILMAPNEAGKSTWCAFLSAMLYGLPTRDHGLLADKNRYAPWSGAAMVRSKITRSCVEPSGAASAARVIGGD